MVISVVHESLKSLLLAIDGSIIMTDQLQDLFNSLFDAKVPIIWMRDSWQSSTLGFWMTELLERNQQLSKWCFVGRPIVFWMSGFFNAQGFLTAMKQEISRAHKDWSLDQITLFNDVTKLSREECRKMPKEGVLVHGLFLDGAGWDRKNGRLIESTNKILYTAMPVIHIFAVNSNVTKNPKLYMCPVYNRIQRTDLNYITSLYLESLKSSDDWILRGVALLCDTK